MTKDSTRGYSYTLDLCVAIEKYTARKIKVDSQVFYYKGMNLQFAVERQLYIRCINSISLFTFYDGLKSGTIDLKVASLNAIEIEIASEFTGARDAMSDVHINWLSFPGYYLLRWLYRYLRAQFLKNRSFVNKTRLKHCPVLLHVVHPKFVTYLKGILNYLAPDQYAYLVTVDSELATELKFKGEPYLLKGIPSSTLRSAFINRTLQKFDELVEIADSVYTAISRTMPRCVVVVEGNAPQDAITAEVCSQLSIPIFCIQQGWSPIVHSGFRNMSFDEMFVWGPSFANLLKHYNPQQRFLVTGSHIIQPIDYRSVSTGRRKMVISFFLQAPCALLSSSSYEDFIELIIWCAREYPMVHLVVREHPSYAVPETLIIKMNEYNNIKFSFPDKDSLADVIQESSLVVSVFSTILLEAVALGTVPLICSIGSMPRYEPDLTGAAIEVNTIVDAKQVIKQVISNPDYLDCYKSMLDVVSTKYFSKGNAAQLISNRIKAVVALH
jgi:hypothetical protein